MNIVIFIFHLLTVPAPKIKCSIWVQFPITQEMVLQACGQDILDRMLDYELRVIEIRSRNEICNIQALDIFGIPCGAVPMGDFQMQIVDPDYSVLICTISMQESVLPGYEDIADQCLEGLAQWESGNTTWSGPWPVEPKSEPAPICPMPEVNNPENPADLATNEPYALLAGQLLWHGYATPDCNGWSGINVQTMGATDCGLISARDAVTRWQNQWDVQILAAANDARVPARLLKAVIGLESQFWPMAVGPIGESGMIQLTDDGADIALRYSPVLFALFCPPALGSICSQIPYHLLRSHQAQKVRDALRASLVCLHCSPGEAVDTAIPDILTYARILAAYRCYTGELVPVADWTTTMAVFHSGSSCLTGGLVCEDGARYVRMINNYEN